MIYHPDFRNALKGFLVVCVIVVGVGGAFFAYHKLTTKDDAAYRADVNRAALNLEIAANDLTDDTVKYARARLARLVPAKFIGDNIAAEIDAMRTANDTLTRLVGNAPSGFATVDAENKRITSRTDAFLRLYRQSFYGDDPTAMVSLMADQGNDLEQYENNLRAVGFLQAT